MTWYEQSRSVQRLHRSPEAADQQTSRPDHYICEVRYGDAAANALQRGLWTHTKNGLKYFDSITGGWIDYSHNLILVSLFSHALVSSEAGHTLALVVKKVDAKTVWDGFSGTTRVSQALARSGYRVICAEGRPQVNSMMSCGVMDE